MLYEGAIKFTRQAIDALEASDFELSYNGLMRAQKIVLELSTSMNFDIAPDLCDKLSALYTYIYRLLVEANMHREAKPAREALELLEYERETWIMLMQNIEQETGADSTESSLKIANSRSQPQYGGQQDMSSRFSANA